VAKQCRETVAEEVKDKERANFCDYFKPRAGAHSKTDLSVGRLVKVFDAEVSAAFGIYAVCLPRRLNDPLISGTVDWLAREAQSSPDAYPPAP
jgi:hypothetical protein